MSTSADAVVLRDVSVGYGSRLALEGIDATIPAGAAVALVGPNGAGKTSLLRAILGLVALRSGSITVLGRSPAGARADVAYVPQASTLEADFPVSVRQVVMMGRYRRVGWVRRPGRGDRAIVEDALGQAGLAARAGDRFETLSGGQRQRVLLARAVAQEARLLLLDEPFTGVDATNQELLLETMSGLRAGGASVVMATHD
ncbi:MAG: ABC transporter ATP-binding protein, partial [Actinomycetota bacterium]|nr:ABC transporter ATP-binding protein [Actinomycetota bacterium]